MSNYFPRGTFSKSSKNASELEMMRFKASVLEASINAALEQITNYGGIDGGHHKQWVLDQVVRTLLRTDAAYEKWVADYCDGEDGPDTYEWDEGIIP